MLLINTIEQHLIKRIESGELSNDNLVQLIKLLGSYLNLKTIPDYATANGMSYPGVRDHRHIEVIFNVKFVIDNE